MEHCVELPRILLFDDCRCPVYIWRTLGWCKGLTLPFFLMWRVHK